jgi:intracellular septation protein A
MKNALAYAFRNFATPVAFYLLFRVAGPKPAILLAVVVTLLQVLVHRLQREPFSPFFIVSSGFTVTFGLMDLLSSSPRFFRLEPFAHNALVATVVMVTLFTGHPLAAWFIRALPRRFQPELETEAGRAYLRQLTWVWVAYLFAKAFLFLYLAFRVDLGQLIVLRSLIGGGSLVLLFGGEIAYRTLRDRRAAARRDPIKDPS